MNQNCRVTDNVEFNCIKYENQKNLVVYKNNSYKLLSRIGYTKIKL
jgi:hypothetical protein